MYRYYVSFSFTSTNGLSIGFAHINRPTPITGGDDITDIRRSLTNQGHTNVAVLAFSLYTNTAHPQRPNQPTRSRHDRAR